MDLQPQEHSFCGYFSFPRIQDVACPEFRSLHFVHSQDPEESYYDLRLNDRLTSWHGFSHCGTFLHGITGNIVTFPSQGSTLVVVVYANGHTRSCFAVGLGRYLGGVRTHIFYYESLANKEAWPSWVDFVKKAFDILWNAPIHEYTTEAVHLLQSVCDVRIACDSSDSSCINGTIDIKQCPGLCCGPRVYSYTSLADELPSLGTLPRRVPHGFELDGRIA